MRQLVRTGHGRRGAGRRFVAHLCAGLLCRHRRTDRAVQGRRRISGHVHLAHAQRRQPTGRSRRGADQDRPRGRAAGRDLPSQGRRQGELAQARPGRSNWSKPPAAHGTADHGRHVPVHRRLDRPERCDAPLGAGRRLAASGSTGCAIRTSASAWSRKCARPPTNGKICCWAPARRTTCCWWASRTSRSNISPARRWPKWPAAAARSPEETAMDLVIEDGSRVDTVYFMMQEDDVRKERGPAVGQFWVGRRLDFGRRARFCSRSRIRAPMATSPAAGQVRPRREDHSPGRGRAQAERAAGREPGPQRPRPLQPGYFADVAVFDPAKIIDHATFAEPHQYATGMVHVFVNGTQVLADGEHTGAAAGRAVWGRGRKTP